MEDQQSKMLTIDTSLRSKLSIATLVYNDNLCNSDS